MKRIYRRWTDENIELLKAMWFKGLRYEDISIVLSEDFGEPISVGQIKGQIARLKDADPKFPARKKGHRFDDDEAKWQPPKRGRPRNPIRRGAIKRKVKRVRCPTPSKRDMPLATPSQGAGNASQGS